MSCYLWTHQAKKEGIKEGALSHVVATKNAEVGSVWALSFELLKKFADCLLVTFIQHLSVGPPCGPANLQLSLFLQ